MKERVIAFSLMTVTVASATFNFTGTQSSRIDDVIKLSIAPLSMSMPRKQEHLTLKLHVQFQEKVCEPFGFQHKISTDLHLSHNNVHKNKQ